MIFNIYLRVSLQAQPQIGRQTNLVYTFSLNEKLLIPLKTELLLTDLICCSALLWTMERRVKHLHPSTFCNFPLSVCGKTTIIDTTAVYLTYTYTLILPTIISRSSEAVVDENAYTVRS